MMMMTTTTMMMIPSLTIRVHNRCFIVFMVFLSACVSIYSIIYISVQPMATTSNKRWRFISLDFDCSLEMLDV